MKAVVRDVMSTQPVTVPQTATIEHAAGTTAGDLMSRPAVTVTEDDTLARAVRLMYLRGLRRLPVLDAAGRLTGIISRSDVLAVYDRLDEDLRVEIISQVIPGFPAPGWYPVIARNDIVAAAT